MILNNSRLRDYEKCPRKFYWSTVRNLWRGSVGIDAVEGTLWHAVMECLYLGIKAELSFSTIASQCYRIIEQHFEEKLQSEDLLLDEEREFLEERCEYFKKLFDAYCERYLSKDRWEIVDTEISAITCLGDACYYCARPYDEDLILGERIQKYCPNCSSSIFYVCGRGDMLIIEAGQLKLVDHKTKGGKSPSISEPYLLAFNESPQFTTYMYILTRVLQRVIPYGIANCVGKLKTITERGNPFHRNEEIQRNDTDFLLFVEDRVNLFQQIERDTAALDPEKKPTSRCFRRNTNACRDYGRCAFYDLCFPNGFAKGNWWELPEGCEFEERDPDYVADYQNLIQEEVR